MQMLGMHGTVAANYAVDHADLLLAIGVRFDDRVTGKLESFAARARIVHVDIDPAEINKNKASHVTVCADAKPSLKVGAFSCTGLKAGDCLQLRPTPTRLFNWSLSPNRLSFGHCPGSMVVDNVLLTCWHC